ncbi:MAG: hypothetical protein NTZ24_05950 [Deltaproteobacteria bacterium]|nr:hypothetical protein [Deltaproteobacteria bacterium]
MAKSINTGENIVDGIKKMQDAIEGSTQELHHKKALGQWRSSNPYQTCLSTVNVSMQIYGFHPFLNGAGFSKGDKKY